jgi:hypothetical protein
MVRVKIFSVELPGSFIENNVRVIERRMAAIRAFQGEIEAFLREGHHSVEITYLQSSAANNAGALTQLTAVITYS